MESLLTTGNITFVIGIIGVIFSVYKSYRNPQVDLDKKQAVDQTAIDGKASILAQQLQWTTESNDKRFAEMQLNLKEATALAQNHLHTVDTKVDALTSIVNTIENNVLRIFYTGRMLR